MLWQLQRKLKCLKLDKSPGPDGINPSVLKEITGGIVEALVMIFQNSLESGKVPENGKGECNTTV